MNKTTLSLLSIILTATIQSGIAQVNPAANPGYPSNLTNTNGANHAQATAQIFAHPTWPTASAAQAGGPINNIQHAGYPEISFAELQAAINNKSVTVIDVNGPVSFARGHIPGAIDFTQHLQDLSNVLPKDKNALIVAYCYGERCGAYARAADVAKNLGYTNVKHFKPGITGWAQAGGSLQQ